MLLAVFLFVAMEEKKRVINWEKIELDYRAGVKTLREIADEHGITHGAVNKRANRDGWVRDLTAKIKAKADALVSMSEVSNSVSREDRIRELEVIDANAQNNAAIQINERKDVTKSRNIVMKLVDELEEQIDCKEEYVQLGEMLRNPDHNGNDKLNDIYMKVISLPGRVDSVKKLSDSLKTLIELERKVYKIDTDSSVDTDKRVNIKVNFVDA